MVVVDCSVSGCTYRTPDHEPSVVTVLLQLHLTQHPPASGGRNGPKLNRPQVGIGINQESWNAFVLRWEAYKTGSRISLDDATVQLLQCADEDLANLLLKSNPGITSEPVDQVLCAMQKLAVIPVARGVTRAELLRMG